MKKKKIFLVLILFICLITISGCKKEEEIPYTKEVDNFNIVRNNIDKQITFEFMKSEDYSIKSTNGSIRFHNELNNYSMELYFIYDYEANSTITKVARDFPLESYHGYKQVQISGYEGWHIYQTNDIFTNYEVNLVLTEPDEAGKVYAVDIKVIQSPLKNDENPFDTKEFVKGEDFKHLLDTIKVVDIDKDESM